MAHLGGLDFVDLVLVHGKCQHLMDKFLGHLGRPAGVFL